MVRRHSAVDAFFFTGENKQRRYRSQMLNNELLIAALVVVVCDTLAFASLIGIRRRLSRGESAAASPLMLILVLVVMTAAHFLALKMVWHRIDFTGANADVGTLMVVLTVLPGLPPAALYSWILVSSVAEHTVNHAAGLGTARKQQSDYSRARSLAAHGRVDAAVASYREYYSADPKNPSPLFHAYRLLYIKHRREEAAEILREIMKTFSKDRPVWAQAATELANYYQNDERDGSRARHILHEIMKKAPKTEQARLAGGRLSGAWTTSNYSMPGKN